MINAYRILSVGQKASSDEIDEAFEKAVVSVKEKYSDKPASLEASLDGLKEARRMLLDENSKDTADGTSRSVEKKPTSNAKLTKPFIQVGIFGVENNAVKTGNQMSKLGLQTNTFEFNEFC